MEIIKISIISKGGFLFDKQSGNLWSKYSKTSYINSRTKNRINEKIKDGDEQAREEFIKGNLRLVLSVIQRFNNRGESPDDVFQIGCIGLIKAIDNFDVSQNVQFSTYAVPMIYLGEIIHIKQ